MGSTKLVFAAFTAMLICGIFIMMKPHVFVLESASDEQSTDTQSVEITVPRYVIMLGSVLIIVGLVGLSVLGFKIFKDLMAEANSENS